MTQPDIAQLVGETVDLVTTEWDESNTSGDTPIIDKSDDIGKGRDLGVYDYVEFSKTSPIGITYADLPMSSQDIDETVFVELKSNTEDRRDELWAEFRRIIESNRKRPDTPGNFDRVVFADITPLDDSTFGAYVYEITLGFEARSRSVET